MTNQTNDILPDPEMPAAINADAVAAPQASTAATTPETTPQASTEVTPIKINDAVIIGTETAAGNALLETPVTLMLGEMWEQRDKRNTQDGQWISRTRPWSEWIIGGPGDNNTPAWGLSRHSVAKVKEGQGIVFGSSIGKARKAKSMENMYAIGLDIDSGTPLARVQEKILKLGLFCIIYTSFNHEKRGLQLKRDDVLQKLKMSTDPSLADIQQYLTQYGKARYEPEFLKEIEIISPKKQVKDGVIIDLQTPPLEKYRLIFPLAAPVNIVGLSKTTHAAALDIWEDKITGLAVKMLGVALDVSCTDPSRIFFVPKHQKDSVNHKILIIQGEPLKFEDITPYKKSLYTANRGIEANPFLEGSAGIDSERPEQVTTASGYDLTAWNTKYGKRLQLATLLETHAPDKLRRTGSEPTGFVSVECPFESENHTNAGGTGSMVGDALDAGVEHWVWSCQHDSCQGDNQTKRLAKALDDGWFPLSALTDPDSEFILRPSDQDIEDEEAEVVEPATDAPADAKSGKRAKYSKTATPHPSYDISAPLGEDLRTAWATLEQRFAYVSHGGKPVFFRRVDPTATAVDRVVETFTHKALIDWHQNRKVPTKGDGKANAAESYLDHAKRYSGVTFAPYPQSCPDNVYNLFSGFAELQKKNGDKDKAKVVKKFLRDVICGGRNDVFKWLWNWLAHMMQRPGEKPGTALVLNGRGGCGKSTFGEMLHAMCAPFSVLASDPEHVVGKFNSHMATAILLVSDEALFAGDPKISGIIKQQTTGRFARIEPKGIDSFEVKSCARYVYIGNPKQVIPIELNGSDRRYLCMTVSDSKVGDTSYFAELNDAIKNGGLVAIMQELMAYSPAEHDMQADWADVREAPLTTERQQMRMHSLRPAQKVLVEMVNSGELIAQDASGRLVRYELSADAETPIEKATLKAAVEKVSDRRDSRADVGNVLEELFGNLVNHKGKKTVTFQRYCNDRELEVTLDGKPDWTSKERAHCYIFPALGLLQARLAEVFAVETVEEDEALAT